MTKIQKTNRFNYMQNLACAIEEVTGNYTNSYELAYPVDYLHRQEVTLTRLNEEICCVEMNEKQLEKHYRKIANAEKRVVDTLAHWGLGNLVEFNGDPRGCAIQLKIKHLTNFYNSWDGESTVINW